MMKTVRAKLLVPILCILIIGSLISGIVGHRATSNVITSAFEEDGLRCVDNLRDDIDMVISKAQLDLLAISVSPAVRNLLHGDQSYEAVIEGYIMALVAQHSIYNSMTILNTDGIIVVSTSGSTGGDRSDREYFQLSMNGEFHISEVEVSRQTGRLATFISIPIHDTDDGSIIGVALAVIRLEELNTNHVIPVNLLGNHGYAMIVTSTGTIIGHRDEDKIIAAGDDDEVNENDGMIPDEMLGQLVLAVDRSITFEAELDGVQYRVFAERSRFTDWFAVVVCPVSEFHESTNYLAMFETILAAVLIFVQVVIIWFVVRGITKALSTTIRYSKDVSKGSLDTTLTIEREDEVGTLAQSLRDMVGNLKNMIEVADKKSMEAEAATAIIMENIRYASKIQKNLLPDDETLKAAFSDYSVIWEPRDVVGGDIFWLKNFDNGSVLCVCDCTGHGTSGALLTTLVVSALEAIVWPDNCHDTANIIWQIEQRLVTVLHVDNEEDTNRGIMDIHDGCDLAVLFIAKDGSVTISAGNINVFVSDGDEVTRHKGQSIFIGEGTLASMEDVKSVRVPANPKNKFYIASDGLCDQIGGKQGKQFGYKAFQQIILSNHNESQAAISNKIWQTFEDYRGDEPQRDDFELVTFKP
ncbi:MAG: SpoIIE family protein phosphatase [Oscillospiraceae bacterium]|jgi:serine phosphatase RsbU (regulator of sigma subunit)|nr:SpoIIE family protein phosphatase [Oscillospiraceae bacterium]